MPGKLLHHLHTLHCVFQGWVKVAPGAAITGDVNVVATGMNPTVVCFPQGGPGVRSPPTHLAPVPLLFFVLASYLRPLCLAGALCLRACGCHAS